MGKSVYQCLPRSRLFRGLLATATGMFLEVLSGSRVIALGERLTSQALDSVRRDLYDLSVFRNVDTALIGDETSRDLLITVEERALWAFEVGGGIVTTDVATGDDLLVFTASVLSPTE